MASTTARPGTLGAVLRFGDCQLHPMTHELWLGGVRQTVRRRVFDLLLLLIEHRPRSVSRAEIAKAVWQRQDVRPSLVAQTVMQARQVIGDVADDPVWILSVRGMGYRFAGTVTEGPVAGPEAMPQTELEALHAAMAEASAAQWAGDQERAQFLADRAITLAQASGINRERAAAMSLASSVALTRGELEQAASLAASALRLAESEGLEGEITEARLQAARVHVVAGDLHGGLSQLLRLHGTLEESGSDRQRRRCERGVVLAYRAMGCCEEALQWCRRAKATGMRAGEVDLRPELTLEVDLMLRCAELQDDSGEPDEARATRLSALDLNAALRENAMADTDISTGLAWLGNQAIALGGLGRLEEAWQSLRDMRRMLDQAPRALGPVNPLWLAGLLREEALLLAKTRRYSEAFDAIQAALDAAQAGGLRSEMPHLLNVAARVWELAGKPQEALQWLRRSEAAKDALQLERAASHALVLRAEAEAETLQRELQSARQLAQQLALENRQLTQRLQQLDRHRTLDEAGFATAEALQVLLAPRHAEARQRDLPFCLAVIVVDNLQALQNQGASGDWLRQLSHAFADLLGPTRHLVRWRADCLVHYLDSLGPRRAREACQRIEADLAAYPWRRGASATPLAPRVRVHCVDAAGDEQLDQAITRVLGGASAMLQVPRRPPPRDAQAAGAGMDADADAD